MTYYAVVNDLIGGWDVSEHNKTTGDHDHEAGEYTLAWGMTELFAKQVAAVLNEQKEKDTA